MNNTDACNMLGQLDRLIDLSNTAKKHVHNWDEVKTERVLKVISTTARGLYEDLGTVKPLN